jgi:hypothetical protein
VEAEVVDLQVDPLMLEVLVVEQVVLDVFKLVFAETHLIH